MNIKEKEATVKIRLNPSCYLHVTMNKKKTIYGGRFEVKKVNDKLEQTWIGEEVWVTQECADKFIRGKRPMARVIETRKREDIISSKNAEVIDSTNFIKAELDTTK